MAFRVNGILQSAITVAALTVFYQVWLKDILFITLGIGKSVLPIEEFPYRCERVPNKLEGCGDMWLDERNRILYAACTGVEARREWNPSLSKFNVSGRRPTGSQLMAIYIDKPGKNGKFKMHRIQPTKYGSGRGEGHLDLAGFDVEVIDSSTVRFWLLNQRPPRDTGGNLLDARKLGSNVTIEVYEHKRGKQSMVYVSTKTNSSMHSPNKIAFLGSNNFVVSNDRSAKVGLRKRFDLILGGGNLVHYDDWFDKYTATAKKLPILGQFVRGNDDRMYVPSLADNKIRIFELEESGAFAHRHSIAMDMPIASITQDSNNDFWAVGRTRHDPIGDASSAAIFKIERFLERRYRYVTTKVLEDQESKSLSGASIARHDVKTGRIFVGGE
ncbi:hypothetical protein BU24DRAFT_459870 [Aaosphaeria arxii CBS 175.79]|uniref:Serum paraoxonase/arylesteras-like protein n=1 Tax=Aaosphaeria arxii CBS 175.79 TaxID=1450172 RepID=A0A6A5Y4U2_9PLEO|nr:uncharacterized protein BU24DRAFT_459870 [Aaosphaeria arxii CBS 175.79]KAF2020276.1 hypothetical protein BU24DRAFT_459870 [Aaosphaeria arxii CBS 175.79]